MGSINTVLKKLFGSKDERDMKQIKPVLAKVLAAYERIDKLTNDELRAESERLKGVIRERIAENEAKKRSCRNELDELNIDVERKEELATEVDKLTKRIDEQIEEVLNEILPEAFAVMKSTARRFKENDVVEVTASDADREFTTFHDYVTVEGSKAYWKNSWMAEETPSPGIWCIMMYS